MKAFRRAGLIALAIIFFLSLSSGFAADENQYSASPPAKMEKKWKIAYYQGGPYQDYVRTLKSIVEGLAELGWLEPVNIPYTEDSAEADKMWSWLAANVKSNYVEFAPDFFYSSNWNDEERVKNKEIVINRLKNKDNVNMILAVGTWAGQDLANNEHSIPTIVCSSSNTVRSKIIKSIEDSGYDHVHADIDPTIFIRQVEAFHDIFRFKKLGVIFQNTIEGKTYAAFGDIQNAAKERKFEIIECHSLPGGAASENNASVVKCARELTDKIDAFYLTQQPAVNDETMPKIFDIMNAAKIPVFSQDIVGVKKGALLSVSMPDFKAYGKFCAGVIGKIINGELPRNISQIYEWPVKIAFNKEAARAAGVSHETYRLLLMTAEDIYEKIE